MHLSLSLGLAIKVLSYRRNIATQKLCFAALHFGSKLMNLFLLSMRCPKTACGSEKNQPWLLLFPGFSSEATCCRAATWDLSPWSSASTSFCKVTRRATSASSCWHLHWSSKAQKFLFRHPLVTGNELTWYPFSLTPNQEQWWNSLDSVCRCWWKMSYRARSRSLHKPDCMLGQYGVVTGG